MSSEICTQNIYQLVASPILLGGLPVYLYDLLVEKKEQTQALLDGCIMIGSSFISKIIANLLNEKIIDQFGGQQLSNIGDYITFPVINLYIYQYLYNEFINKQYRNTINNRNNNLYISKLLPVGLSVLQQFMDQWIVSLLTGIIFK